jgi:hypothetical protein
MLLYVFSAFVKLVNDRFGTRYFTSAAIPGLDFLLLLPSLLYSAATKREGDDGGAPWPKLAMRKTVRFNASNLKAFHTLCTPDNADYIHCKGKAP